MNKKLIPNNRFSFTVNEPQLFVFGSYLYLAVTVTTLYTKSIIEAVLDRFCTSFKQKMILLLEGVDYIFI